MFTNQISQSENQKSTRHDENCSSNLFDFINSIKADGKSDLIFLQNLQITYSQARSLSGFKSSSFLNTKLYDSFYNKIHQIESINFLCKDFNSCHLIRIMILISLLSINDEGKKEKKLNLKLQKINNESIKQDEFELANQIRNIDKTVDLINEGWVINCINYEQNNTKNIESIEFSKETEKITIITKTKSLPIKQQNQFFLQTASPSSPHPNQHSATRKKRLSTRQFDRTDYSNESSNNYEDYDYYTDDDDEILKDTLENEKESRLSLSRRTYSEPFININPMILFGNDKSKNREERKLFINEKIEHHYNDDIYNKTQLKKNNTDFKKIRNTAKNNNERNHNCYSYSSNSSDFDDNYYSSGDEEIASDNSNEISANEKIENIRNYSNERRRHHRRHHISKRIKNKIELRKLEDSPRRSTQLYIDEFDDVRKLQPSYKQQQHNFPEISTQNCKNNNKRDLDFDYENEFNDSDDSDDYDQLSQTDSSSHLSSNKAASSSPYELIGFKDNKKNFNEIDINDQDLNEDDGQIAFGINLDSKLNLNSESNEKNQMNNPILLNFPNGIEEDDDDEIEEDEDEEINSSSKLNNINSIPDLTEINEFIYDNENSSSDSNEEIDDLVFEQNKNEITKNNNKNNKFENKESFSSFEQNDEIVESFPDAVFLLGEKVPQLISDDIYCSEPFPVGAGNSNDNSLLSPNHRKIQRNSKKKQVNSS